MNAALPLLGRIVIVVARFDLPGVIEVGVVAFAVVPPVAVTGRPTGTDCTEKIVVFAPDDGGKDAMEVAPGGTGVAETVTGGFDALTGGFDGDPPPPLHPTATEASARPMTATEIRCTEGPFGLGGGTRDDVALPYIEHPPE